MTTPHLNRLYRRVIASSERLDQLKAMHAPDIVLRNEHRVLKDAMQQLQDVLPAHPLSGDTGLRLAQAA